MSERDANSRPVVSDDDSDFEITLPPLNCDLLDYRDDLRAVIPHPICDIQLPTAVDDTKTFYRMNMNLSSFLRKQGTEIRNTAMGRDLILLFEKLLSPYLLIHPEHANGEKTQCPREFIYSGEESRSLFARRGDVSRVLLPCTLISTKTHEYCPHVEVSFSFDMFFEVCYMRNKRMDETFDTMDVNKYKHICCTAMLENKGRTNAILEQLGAEPFMSESTLWAFRFSFVMGDGSIKVEDFPLSSFIL